MNDLTMGQRIAEERKKLGISQEGLGEKTGVSRQAISKWESDAAVPEIDKLISLSKLFGVSVGWLLGVEDRSEQRSDELNETQLKMVEEIVQRYQPEPEAKQGKMEKLRLGLVCLVALSAILALTILGLRKPDAETQNLVGQITSLRQENQEIQSRLDAITGQLEAMGQGAVLTDYSMELVDVSLDFADQYVPKQMDAGPGTSVVTDIQITFAKLFFQAIPQQRQEEDAASLVVYLNGREVSTVPLDWMDNAYRAEFVLPVNDGYEYCFVLDRAGSQQRQSLRQTGYTDLAELTAIELEMFDPTEILYDGTKLVIKDMTYSYYLCGLGMERGWTWEKLDFVLVQDGTEISRYAKTPAHELPDGTVSPGGVARIMMASFPTDDLQEGADIRLYIDAELSSGVTARVWVMSMALQKGEIEYGIISN